MLLWGIFYMFNYVKHYLYQSFLENIKIQIHCVKSINLNSPLGKKRLKGKLSLKLRRILYHNLLNYDCQTLKLTQKRVKSLMFASLTVSYRHGQALPSNQQV